MTVTPFSNLTSAVNSLPAIVAVHFELVRGTESEVLAKLLPRVKNGSIALDLANVERIDAAHQLRVDSHDGRQGIDGGS